MRSNDNSHSENDNDHNTGHRLPGVVAQARGLDLQTADR